MFTIVRRIHLFTSVFLMAFVAMYFVTGFGLIHDDWFPRKPISTTTRPATLQYTDADLPYDDPIAAGEFVKQKLGLTGQVNPQQKPPAKKGWTWRFTIGHPGVSYNVAVAPNPKATTAPSIQSTTQPTTMPTTMPAVIKPNVTITEYDFGPAGTSNGFHRLRGFSGGWGYKLWSLMYDASALSLILFSLTGIYLWWKLSKIRWPGALVLAFGILFPIATFMFLAMSK